MSKIDDFNAARFKLGQVEEFTKHLFRTYSGSSKGFLVDKFGAKVSLTETYIGDYGNSSTYPWSDLIRKEVEKQICIELRGLVERATERVKKETEIVRLEAVEEASNVLKEIS